MLKLVRFSLEIFKFKPFCSGPPGNQGERGQIGEKNSIQKYLEKI